MEPFRVYILGCGSALPTMKHQPSSQIVEVRGKSFMIDCGEGTQNQLRKLHIGFTKINAVFISHLHGDHCFGLIGMISTFGMLGRTAPLHVYGPAELGKLLDVELPMFCSGLEYQVTFHAVDTKVAQIIYEDRGVSVETIPLNHRIDCCGFLFREKPTLPHIRRDMIDFYHIPISQINNIKAGKDWTNEDGDLIPNTRLVTPADPPRAYAYCSDTKYMPELHRRVAGVDLLYHESTYDASQIKRARLYYHSTAEQAATVAKDGQVKKLLLGHYSARYNDESTLLNEAKAIFPNTELTTEGMIINV
ncbi:ribonuclease Z [Prevotella sp. DNF00663]|uniref:ribonuclease Z n=1 Tax=unclassified Prevotella TaxID=2638335 RepID=UPI000513F496|nr:MULTISPECIES: ribonuclease Z [unclassified Prevotella]KGI61492.1 ribonuclease Z [Prevotella sp. S7 MS 2]KXB85153.1 ribonuclease Z [Prevotella sp. DNF00663]